MADNIVTPSPLPKIIDYPGAIGVALVVILTIILLVVSGRFDATGGTLTISFMVVLGFLGLVVYAALFTIPNDEITSSAIGGLTAAFGAIIAYWLGKPREPPK
jgi:hypothetical protein